MYVYEEQEWSEERALADRKVTNVTRGEVATYINNVNSILQITAEPFAGATFCTIVFSFFSQMPCDKMSNALPEVKK